MDVVDRMARLAMIAQNGVNCRGSGNVPQNRLSYP